MSLRAFLFVEWGAPAGLWLAAAAVPITIFFFLRRRLKDRVIGSTMLWRKALEEMPARSSWRRPTEWLSLFLLLLSVLLLTLAAADARLGLGDGGASALVIVLDQSVTMTAEHVGGTRFDEAKRSAAAAVDAMRSGDHCVIIGAGVRPRVLSHATDDSGALVAVLRAVEPETAASDLRAAVDAGLREAERMVAETKLPARLVVFSDFTSPAEAWKGFEPEKIEISFATVGKEIANAGITHASLSVENGTGSILVGLLAAPGTRGERTLSLYRDDELVDTRAVTIAPEGIDAAVFRVEPSTSRAEKWRVALEPKDDFPADDEASIGSAPRPTPVLAIIGDADPFLDRLSEVFPEVDIVRASAADAATAGKGMTRPFDLAIFTSAPAPEAVPQARQELWIGCLPSDLGVTTDGDLIDPPIVDWDRRHPALRGIGFEEFVAVNSKRLVLPPGAEECVRVNGGVQLARVVNATRSVYVFASEMNASNLPLVPAFPLLVKNLLGASLGGIFVDARKAEPPLRIAAGLDLIGGSVDLEATSPSGASDAAKLWGAEEYFWQGPLELGFYEFAALNADGAARRYVGTNVFSDRATRQTRVLPDLRASPGAAVMVTSSESWRGSRPIWRIAAFIAALALIAEAVLWLRR